MLCVGGRGRWEGGGGGGVIGDEYDKQRKEKRGGEWREKDAKGRFCIFFHLMGRKFKES